jgi:hypothetical protein
MLPSNRNSVCATTSSSSHTSSDSSGSSLPWGKPALRSLLSGCLDMLVPSADSCPITGRSSVKMLDKRLQHSVEGEGDRHWRGTQSATALQAMPGIWQTRRAALCTMSKWAERRVHPRDPHMAVTWP